MFQKIAQTQNPPDRKPLLIWDGACGFCKYWYLHLKSKIGDRMDYAPYQDAHQRFHDIPYKEFQKASRLIESNGTVYTGPDSLYRSMLYLPQPRPLWHKLYVKNRFFNRLSDVGYDWISKHRPQLYRVTVRLFGKNPVSQHPYWAWWLLLLTGGVVILAVVL